ncbi:unnamed protein product, partial [Musa hybrid cultivar]
FGPPQEFPLASPRSGIVHHLSGPDMHAPTRTLHRRSGSAGGATPREGSRPLASLCLPGFRTRRLARIARHACSNSNPSQKIGVGRRCNPSRGFPPVSFLVPSGFPHPSTRTHVRLLGPCFKTGRMGSPLADA